MFWHKFWFEPETGRLRCWWRVLAFLAVALSVSLLLTVILAFPLLSSISDPAHLSKSVQQTLTSLLIPMMAVAFVLVGTWAVRTFDGLPGHTLGLAFHRTWWRTFAMACGSGIALIGILLGVISLTGNAEWQAHTLSSRQWQALLEPLLSFLISAISIEVIFHGYLFQTLLRSIGPVAALLLVALLAMPLAFISGQAPPIAVANVVVLLVFAGMLYLRTGTLWAPIGFHVGWNFALLCGDLPISGAHASMLTPMTVTLHLPGWLSGGGYGLGGGAAVSALLLAALALATHSRIGLSLTSCWWQWRHLHTRRRQPPAWDFSIGSRHYQWKLLAHDPAE